MLSSELDYDLPDALIAQRPPERRDGGRLLCVGDTLQDLDLARLPELVPAGALVVLNDTRVMKARVFAQRPTGARLEVLFLDPHPVEPLTWQVMVRSNRPIREGDRATVGGAELRFGDKLPQGTRWVSVTMDVVELLERHGRVPLPPYMRRADERSDEQRYQTVFARQLGSAAAPTAGLHLTQELLDRMRERGVEIGFVTLHVGAGTFKPVSTETVEQHPMHEEHYELSDAFVTRLHAARARGAAVVAVGTTVVRTLESAAAHGFVPGRHSTRLLISPGFRFAVVDALLTNFHAPRSTLLALVYAFAGAQRMRAAYQHAVAERYRFLSYGDAMWIPRRCS